MMEGYPLKRRDGPVSGEGDADMDAKPLRAVSNEETIDFSLDELRDFLAADPFEPKADPEFKERLREKLWDLVQSKFRRP